MREERLFVIDWPSRLGRVSESGSVELPASPLCRAGVWSLLVPRSSREPLCE